MVAWAGRALFKDYANFHGARSPTDGCGRQSRGDGENRLDGRSAIGSLMAGSMLRPRMADPHPIALIAVEMTDLSTDLAEPPPALVWPDPPNTRASGVIWTNLVIGPGRPHSGAVLYDIRQPRSEWLHA